MNPMPILFAFATSLLTVAGQILMKMQAQRLGVAPDGAVATAWHAVRGMTGPFGLAGLACAGCAAATWFLALTRLPLSKAYPIMALNFIIVPLLSSTWLGERLGVGEWIGVLLIATGLVVFGLSAVPRP